MERDGRQETPIKDDALQGHQTPGHHLGVHTVMLGYLMEKKC